MLALTGVALTDVAVTDVALTDSAQARASAHPVTWAAQASSEASLPPPP